MDTKDDPKVNINAVVSDFDQECFRLAAELTRWRNAAIRGLRNEIDNLYIHSPVGDQTEFECGREHGLNQVMEIIDRVVSDR